MKYIDALNKIKEQEQSKLIDLSNMLIDSKLINLFENFSHMH